MESRAEHLQWAKDRALKYADQEDMTNAIASLASDLQQHPDTAPSANIVAELMLPLAMMGKFDRPGELRKFIEGFN